MSVENEDRGIIRNTNIDVNMVNNNMLTALMDANDMMQNNSQNACECKDDKRNEMLKKIKYLQFSIIELALYLDTHPEDEKALCLHNKYSKEFKELKDKYQKVYGPLTINYPCNKWRWLEEPWPWEGGKN